MKVDLYDLLRSMHLRYLTPREIARLHSFPARFVFPPSVSHRQKYALLGNSLSVKVVSTLLKWLVSDWVLPEG